MVEASRVALVSVMFLAMFLVTYLVVVAVAEVVVVADQLEVQTYAMIYSLI